MVLETIWRRLGGTGPDPTLPMKRSAKKMIKRNPDLEDHEPQFWLGFEIKGRQASKAAAFFAREGYETRTTPDGTFLTVANPARGGVFGDVRSSSISAGRPG